MASSKLLIDAIKKSKSPDFILKFLQSGADPNATDGQQTALYHAVSQGGDCVQIIDSLLHHGAKPDFDAFDLALTEFNANMIEKLIQHGADPNGHNPAHGNALHTMSGSRQADRSKVCEILIQHGVEVDHENECYNTPLFFAVDSENVEIIETLLQYGARPCYFHWRGTPLVRSFGQLPTHCVEMMVKYAALQVNHGLEKDVQEFFENFGNKMLHSEQQTTGKPFMNLAKHCMEEIEIMKGIKLSKNGESLFDFALSQNAAIFLQSNPRVLKTVLDHIPFFIIYRNILFKRIDKQHIRSTLMSLSTSTYWNYDVKSKFVILDMFIVENIAKYLSKADTLNLYLAFALADKPNHKR